MTLILGLASGSLADRFIPGIFSSPPSLGRKAAEMLIAWPVFHVVPPGTGGVNQPSLFPSILVANACAVDMSLLFLGPRAPCSLFIPPLKFHLNHKRATKNIPFFIYITLVSPSPSIFTFSVTCTLRRCRSCFFSRLLPLTFPPFSLCSHFFNNFFSFYEFPRKCRLRTAIIRSHFFSSCSPSPYL